MRVKVKVQWRPQEVGHTRNVDSLLHAAQETSHMGYYQQDYRGRPAKAFETHSSPLPTPVLNEAVHELMLALLSFGLIFFKSPIFLY